MAGKSPAATSGPAARLHLVTTPHLIAGPGSFGPAAPSPGPPPMRAAGGGGIGATRAPGPTPRRP
ncbi:hypothetical protein, partial [Nocardia carnea]|uniref:hypothetical protein n=1 Tax=Nocardia carnea TaxID=37328 RepID=UPI0024564D93